MEKDNTKQPSPKKPQQSSTPNTNNNDRLKRDEWSEGAVSTLLEAYEGKWILRNRAKLKGQDWEDVAKQVSGRSNNSKSMKTQTQCKNKIESMKKRYRSESAAAEASAWPLYPRLDLLLRGNSGGGVASPPVKVEQPVVAVAQLVLQGQNSNGSNEVDRMDDKVDYHHNNVGTKSMEREPESERNLIPDSDSSASTPAVYTEKAHEKNAKVPGHETENERKKQKVKNGNKRKRREESWGLGESVRWVAQVVARCEEARMETMKEIERMRAEAEAKRAEMDLKRTEIIANTMLEIAKLFANRGGTSDSSNLRTGRS